LVVRREPSAGTNYATITVNAPTGGSGNYTIYDFKKLVQYKEGKQHLYRIGFIRGSYTINVYDDKGCSELQLLLSILCED
jgi:hypothetical protein